MPRPLLILDPSDLHGPQTALLSPFCTMGTLWPAALANVLETMPGPLSRLPMPHCPGKSARLLNALVSLSDIQERTPTWKCLVQAAWHTSDRGWPGTVQPHLKRTTLGSHPHQLSILGTVTGLYPLMLSIGDHAGLPTHRQACSASSEHQWPLS